MTIRFNNHFVAIRHFKLTIYSDFVNTNITIKNTSINLNVMGTTAINHSLFDCSQGEGLSQVVRFESTVNTLALQKVIIDGDRPGVRDMNGEGRMVQSSQLSVTAGQKHTLQMPGLPGCPYYLEVLYGDSTRYVEKIFKQ